MSGIITTGRVGISETDTVYEYVSPNTPSVVTGPTVTYGAWQNIPEGTALTVPGVYQLQAGTFTATGTGPNVARTVTIT